MGSENPAPPGIHDVAVVAVTADLLVRRQQCKEPQLGEHRRIRLQARMHEHTGLMWVGDHLLDNAEAPLRIGVDDTKPKNAGLDALQRVVQLAFIVEQSLPIGDQVLQVSDLRPVDRRVVHLVEDALGNGEPAPAQGRVRGPYTVLVAAGPARFDPGTAERRVICQQDRHSESMGL